MLLKTDFKGKKLQILFFYWRMFIRVPRGRTTLYVDFGDYVTTDFCFDVKEHVYDLVHRSDWRTEMLYSVHNADGL